MPFKLRTSVKDTIVEHFAKKKINFDEDALISILESSKNKYDVYWAVIGLREIGTNKCIPHLKSLRNFPMLDVKDCLLLTIAHISRAEETPFYVEILKEKGSRKEYAMWAIKECADERAIEPVSNYLFNIFKKLKQPKCTRVSDAYINGLIYLSRYYDKEKFIKNIFEMYLEIKDKIPAEVKERIGKEVPNFKFNS